MRERTVRIYTLLMTVTDEDRGLFQSTTEHGSFLSPRLAQWEMEQLIAQERTNLGAVYDCEERTDTAWEAYEAGNAASHLVRIEIVTSLLRLPSAGKDAGLEMDLLQETTAIQSSSVEQRLEQVDRLYQLQMELCRCLEGVDFDMRRCDKVGKSTRYHNSRRATIPRNGSRSHWQSDTLPIPICWNT